MTEALFFQINNRSLSIGNPRAAARVHVGRVAGLPARTGGRMVVMEDGSAVFRYRRWCVLDEHNVPLPEGTLHLERGVFSPSLVHQADREERKLLLFLPRYRGHEENMVGHLKLHGVRDHAMLRGFAAVKGWVKSMLRRRSARVEDT